MGWIRGQVLGLFFVCLLAVPSTVQAFSFDAIGEYFSQLTSAARKFFDIREAPPALVISTTTKTPAPGQMRHVCSQIPAAPLRAGDYGKEVAQLQQILKAIGMYQLEQVTGSFGAYTKQALGMWQIKQQLISALDDARFGVYDDQTRQALVQFCQQKIDAITAAEQSAPGKPTWQARIRAFIDQLLARTQCPVLEKPLSWQCRAANGQQGRWVLQPDANGCLVYRCVTQRMATNKHCPEVSAPPQQQCQSPDGKPGEWVQTRNALGCLQYVCQVTVGGEDETLQLPVAASKQPQRQHSRMNQDKTSTQQAEETTQRGSVCGIYEPFAPQASCKRTTTGAWCRGDLKTFPSLAALRADGRYTFVFWGDCQEPEKAVCSQASLQFVCGYPPEGHWCYQDPTRCNSYQGRTVITYRNLCELVKDGAQIAYPGACR